VKAQPAGLSRGVFALARTKRKRFLWCAWWTAEPSAKPFRAPDAWGGGADTREAAQALAERAAGRPLSPVDDHWAGAWKRHLAGLEPFPKHTVRVAKGPAGVDPYQVLGLTSAASMEEVKLAFRQRALAEHPDQGGSAENFIALKHAYDAIVKRRRRSR
jgi:hypothetical protein